MKDILNISSCDVEVLIILKFMLEYLDLVSKIKLVKTGTKTIKGISKLSIRFTSLKVYMATFILIQSQGCFRPPVRQVWTYVFVLLRMSQF